MTILLIEQNAKLALEVSDRGYVMESGEITLAGEATALLHDPEGARRVSRRSGVSRRRHLAAGSAFPATPVLHRTGVRRLRATVAGDTPRADRARGRVVFRSDAAVEARPRRLHGARARDARVQPGAQPRADRRHRARRNCCCRCSNAACCTRASPPTGASRRAAAHLIGALRPRHRARWRPSSRRRSSFSPSNRLSRRRSATSTCWRPRRRRRIDVGRRARRDLRRRHPRVAAAHVRAVRRAVRRRRASRRRSRKASRRSPAIRGPLLLFGALSFALLMLGLATSGLGCCSRCRGPPRRRTRRGRTSSASR